MSNDTPFDSKTDDTRIATSDEVETFARFILDLPPEHRKVAAEKVRRVLEGDGPVGSGVSIRRTSDGTVSVQDLPPQERVRSRYV